VTQPTRHEVVATVRSDEKGRFLVDSHKGKALSYVIVKDIAQEGAFDEAVKSNPPFDAVLHTASPFHFNATDPKKDMLDPAIIGTTGILKAIKANAPLVKRVAITSSFAAIVNSNNHKLVYNEDVWNPVTMEEAMKDPATAYRASKTFAEKAAWDFVEKEKPDFSLSTLNPPFVFGPVVHSLNSLESTNTSNQRILGIMQGKMKEKVAPTGAWIWVDVRDVALAHVRAIELLEAAGKRFFITAGYMTNKDLIDVIRDEFPELRSRLPENAESDLPSGVFKYDNSRSINVLGLKYRTLKESVIDTVKSLHAVGA
jgi:nucleoside-diphosphate-sugar epimerase